MPSGTAPPTRTYIETISKRGYRLIAPVSGLGPPSADPAHGAWCFKITLEGREIELKDGGENLVGRGQDATVRIDNPEVSRRHARLVVAGDTVTLEDLGSKNGTHRNGRRLTAPVALADGDEIWIGRTWRASASRSVTTAPGPNAERLGPTPYGILARNEIGGGGRFEFRISNFAFRKPHISQ